MHTHIYIHFHTSHISHIRANTRHELLTADFASPHTADGPAYPSRPAADNLQLRFGLCARQHNQSQPSLRTHALSGTPDGAFCRRVRHPPPAHSSPAPCTCPPKPPAPLSPPNNRTPGRAPAPGSLSHSLRGHKTACAETVSRRPCSDTPHTAPKHINAAQKPPTTPPSAYAPAHPTPEAKRGGLGGAYSTGGARQVAATCTERFGPRCRSGKIGYQSAHTRQPVSAPKNPTAIIHHVIPTPVGLSHARAGWWGRCGTALARGHPHEGAHSGGDPPQTAPTAPSAPRQTDAEGAAPLAAGPWCPRPNAPPKAGEASPRIPFLGCYPGWQQAGSLRRRWRASPKVAQTAVSPQELRRSGAEASLPTPKASLSSPRMQPTAWLDPRSARRRAKRGARRGAITAHRL
jgi:hypothetical protein